jgi:hypothetical protein
MSSGKRAGRRFWRLIITTVRQGGGHPWVDSASTNDAEGNAYRSVAIRPSLRRQWDRPGGTAVVVGWRR